MPGGTAGSSHLFWVCFVGRASGLVRVRGGGGGRVKAGGVPRSTTGAQWCGVYALLLVDGGLGCCCGRAVVRGIPVPLLTSAVRVSGGIKAEAVCRSVPPQVRGGLGFQEEIMCHGACRAAGGMVFVVHGSGTVVFLFTSAARPPPPPMPSPWPWGRGGHDTWGVRRAVLSEASGACRPPRHVPLSFP